MTHQILKCKSCNKYTMKEICPSCGNKAISPAPAKFSPEDKWGKYRRMAKKDAQNAISNP